MNTVSWKDLCLLADNNIKDEPIKVYEFGHRKFYEPQNKQYEQIEEEED